FTFVPAAAVDWVTGALVKRLELELDWRRDLPLGDDLHDFAAARLQALRDVLEELTPEDLLGEPEAADDQAGVAPADQLRRAAPISYSLASDPDDGAPMLEVSAGGTSVLIDREALPLVAGLTKHDDFVASAAAEWSGIEWNETSRVLQALVDSGVL